jgi:hypothetical protein
MRRLMILDECVSKKVGAELRRRGRNAKGVLELGLGGKDDALLEQIAERFPGAILVTGDDRMPADHAETLAMTGITVATIDPIRPPEFRASEWNHEVVQRWAHVIETQTRGTVRRYGLANRLWTDRRQPNERLERAPAAPPAEPRRRPEPTPQQELPLD